MSKAEELFGKDLLGLLADLGGSNALAKSIHAEITKDPKGFHEISKRFDGISPESVWKMLQADRIESISGRTESNIEGIIETEIFGSCIVNNLRIVHMDYQGRRFRTGPTTIEFPDDPNATTTEKVLREKIKVDEYFKASPEEIVVDGTVLYTLDTDHEMWGIDQFDLRGGDAKMINNVCSEFPKEF